MAKEKKRSLFQRLTGGISMKEDDSPDSDRERIQFREESPFGAALATSTNDPWIEEETEGELALDVYQTNSEIIVQTFVAGVRPEDLEINITRDMLTVRGKREENRSVREGDFFSRELYWGAFSRTISLPQEVEPDAAEAMERHGLLTIRMPKIDKDKRSNLKVKSL